MPPPRSNALEGLIVAERAGRIASGVCGTLLAQMGARVMRVEPGSGRPRSDPAVWHQHPLVCGWKQRYMSGSDRQWRALAAKADVAIYSLAAGETAMPDGARIDCVFSAFGKNAPSEEPHDAGDLLLQAAGGLMAVTGDATGLPQAVRTPVLEIFAGINGAISILAALRLGTRERRMLDIAVFDAAVAALGTFHAIALNDPARRFRDGCRHPLNAPWNVYGAREGWIVICTASQEQWLKVLELSGHPELAYDARFADSATRVRHVADVDAVVQAWLAQAGTEVATAALTSAGVPAGPVQAMHEVIARERAAGRTLRLAGDTTVPECARSLFAAGTETRPTVSDVTDHLESSIDNLPVRREPAPAASTAVRKPLAGIRAVEVSLYTAGPLAGRYLADLGADVIKIEAPEGEPARAWPPQYNGVGGYFANYNAGKRGLRLNLKTPADNMRLAELVAGADILLQNLRTGALPRLGFGYDALHALHPQLIYCSISGYGQQGSNAPALDTVIQAGSGLMDLGAPSGEAAPLKAGFSLADLIAAHLAPLFTLAALAQRDRGATGTHLDVNMLAALTSITQLAWHDRGNVYPAGMPIECVDGWVACTSADSTLARATRHTRAECATRLMAAGHEATPVLEVHEVLASQTVARRGLLHHIGSPDAIPVLSAPFRWNGSAPYPSAPLAE